MRDGVQDVVFCYLRFPSGVVAHLHLSWLDPHKERRLTVVGAKRMATFDDMLIEGKLTIYDKGFDEDSRSWGEYIARSGDIFSPRISNAEPLRIECEHFVECIRTGATPRSDGAQRAAGRARAGGAPAIARRTAEPLGDALAAAIDAVDPLRAAAIDAQHGADRAADAAQHVGMAEAAVAEERPQQRHPVRG